MRCIVALLGPSLAFAAASDTRLKLHHNKDTSKSFKALLKEWAAEAPTDNEHETQKSAFRFKFINKQMYPAAFAQIDDNCAEIARMELGEYQEKAIRRALGCEGSDEDSSAESGWQPDISAINPNDPQMLTHEFYKRQALAGSHAADALYEMCSEITKWKVETSKSSSMIVGRKCNNRFPNLATRCSPYQPPSCSAPSAHMQHTECIVPVKCTSPENTYSAIDTLTWDASHLLTSILTTDIQECGRECSHKAALMLKHMKEEQAKHDKKGTHKQKEKKE